LVTHLDFAMLAGFLFLGILAASSLPDMMDLWRADTGDDG